MSKAIIGVFDFLKEAFLLIITQTVISWLKYNLMNRNIIS